jgi:hypothetical protein
LEFKRRFGLGLVTQHLSPSAASKTKWNVFMQGSEHEQSSALVESDDDHLKALNYILEAWEVGADNGVAPEMMAYAAIYTALSDLVAGYGEDHVIRLVEGLKPRVQKGEFTVYRTKQ